jgi:hypothetical protein
VAGEWNAVDGFCDCLRGGIVSGVGLVAISAIIRTTADQSALRRSPLEVQTFLSHEVEYVAKLLHALYNRLEDLSLPMHQDTRVRLIFQV